VRAGRQDGPEVRGAKDAAGNQPHLLAALVGTAAQSSVVAAQAEVGAKAVPGQIDLNGKLVTADALHLVTADALHTVKASAEFIREAGGEFVLPVKENRKALFDALDALPWHQVPSSSSASHHDLETAVDPGPSILHRRRLPRWLSRSRPAADSPTAPNGARRTVARVQLPSKRVRH
jgi:hypothetical protein